MEAKVPETESGSPEGWELNPTDKMSSMVHLKRVWDAVWNGKWIIVGATALGFLWGIISAHSAGPSYVITVQLMPSDSDRDRVSAISSVTSLFGGQADTPISRFKQFQVALFTPGMADVMDKKYHVLCGISPNCDPATNKWSPRGGFGALISSTGKFILGMPPRTDFKPTSVEFAQYIKSVVKTDLSREGLLTLTMGSASPEFAKQFLSRLIVQANDYIKERDAESLRQYVDYLSAKLSNMENLSQREALQNLLLEQNRRLMLTRVNVPYAATPLDAPIAVTVSPIPIVIRWAAIGFIFGSIIALLAGFAPHILRRDWLLARVRR